MIETVDRMEKEENAPQDASSERALWLSVVVLAMEDWTNGTLRARREAQQFLFEDKSDFFSVCANAGLDGSALRTKLLKIGRRVQMEGALPYRAAA